MEKRKALKGEQASFESVSTPSPFLKRHIQSNHRPPNLLTKSFEVMKLLQARTLTLVEAFESPFLPRFQSHKPSQANYAVCSVG